MSNTGRYRGLKLEDTSGQPDCSDGKLKSVENPADTLRRLADLFEAKNKEYGAGYKKHGHVMAALLPEGISLDGSEEFARFAVFNLMVVKMVRYTANFSSKHKDSLDDLAVYAAMMRDLDNV